MSLLKVPEVNIGDGCQIEKDPEAAISMNDMFMSIMKTLGVKDLFIEVDTINKQIFKFHKINGAKVVSTFTLPDGRERTEMVYDLTKIKFRFI